MKLGWIVAGQTYQHRETLKDAGFAWYPTFKIWGKCVAEAGHDKATMESEEQFLEGLQGIIFNGVDFDCMREGNETWLKQEVDVLIASKTENDSEAQEDRLSFTNIGLRKENAGWVVRIIVMVLTNDLIWKDTVYHFEVNEGGLQSARAKAEQLNAEGWIGMDELGKGER